MTEKRLAKPAPLVELSERADAALRRIFLALDAIAEDPGTTYVDKAVAFYEAFEEVRARMRTSIEEELTRRAKGKKIPELTNGDVRKLAKRWREEMKSSARERWEARRKP